MTEEQRKEYLDRLLELSKDTYGIECNHIVGDRILCEILLLLGYDDIVSAYDKIQKWYS